MNHLEPVTPRRHHWASIALFAAVSLLSATSLAQEVSAWTPDAAKDNTGSEAADARAPTTPRNLRVVGVTSSSISLAWDASSDDVGVTRYDVLQNAAIVGGDAQASMTVTGLAADVTFTYSIRALDAAGNLSGPSNQVSVTTLPGRGDGRLSRGVPLKPYSDVRSGG